MDEVVGVDVDGFVCTGVTLTMDGNVDVYVNEDGV